MSLTAYPLDENNEPVHRDWRTRKYWDWEPLPYLKEGKNVGLRLHDGQCALKLRDPTDGKTEDGVMKIHEFLRSVGIRTWDYPIIHDHTERSMALLALKPLDSILIQDWPEGVRPYDRVILFGRDQSNLDTIGFMPGRVPKWKELPSCLLETSAIKGYEVTGNVTLEALYAV